MKKFLVVLFVVLFLINNQQVYSARLTRVVNRIELAKHFYRDDCWVAWLDVVYQVNPVYVDKELVCGKPYLDGDLPEKMKGKTIGRYIAHYHIEEYKAQIEAEKEKRENEKLQDPDKTYSTYVDVADDDPDLKLFVVFEKQGLLKVEKGRIKPDSFVSRQESAYAVGRSFFLAPSRFPSPFSVDVEKDEIFAPYIWSLLEIDYRNSYPDNHFYPDVPLKKNELISMIMTASKRVNKKALTPWLRFEDVDYKSWYIPYLRSAIYHGIVPQIRFFYPEKEITRREFVQIVSKAILILGYKD